MFLAHATFLNIASQLLTSPPGVVSYIHVHVDYELLIDFNTILITTAAMTPPDLIAVCHARSYERSHGRSYERYVSSYTQVQRADKTMSTSFQHLFNASPAISKIYNKTPSVKPHTQGKH